MSEVFVVESSGYDGLPVAVFSTRALAEAWVDAANAQSLANAGVQGLSCQSKEEAAQSYFVSNVELPLDPKHPPLRTPAEELDRVYGSRARYDEWMSGGRYYMDP